MPDVVYKITEYSSMQYIDELGINWANYVVIRVGIHEFPVRGYPDQVGPAPIQLYRVLYLEDVEEIVESLSDHARSLRSQPHEEIVEYFFQLENIFPETYGSAQHTSLAPRCILDLEYTEEMLEDLSFHQNRLS